MPVPDPAKQWIALPGQDINPVITAVLSFFSIMSGYGLLGQFFKGVNWFILYIITIGVGLCCFLFVSYDLLFTNCSLTRLH